MTPTSLVVARVDREREAVVVGLSLSGRHPAIFVCRELRDGRDVALCRLHHDVLHVVRQAYAEAKIGKLGVRTVPIRSGGHIALEVVDLRVLEISRRDAEDRPLGRPTDLRARSFEALGEALQIAAWEAAA